MATVIQTPAETFEADVNHHWQHLAEAAQPRVAARERSLTEREHERLKRTLKYAVAACLEEVGTPDTLTTIAEEFHSWALEFGGFSQQERFQLAGMIHKLAEDAEQASL